MKMRLDLEVGMRTVEEGATAGDMSLAAAEVEPLSGGYRITVATEEDSPLRQNVWKLKNMPLPPSVNGKTVAFERGDCVYALAFGKNGQVTDTLRLASNPKKALKKGKPVFSVVDHADGVWLCELFGSVIVDSPDGGEGRIRCRVEVTDNGDLSCELVE